MTAVAGAGTPLRVGTQPSALARWQAEHVAGLPRGLPGGPAVELEFIETEGDKMEDVALSHLHGMLDRGIYLPPSPFEALFLSVALTGADVDRTVAAAGEVSAEVFG